MALLEARADHGHKPPTRASVNTAEPAEAVVKGSKITEQPPDPHNDPNNREPADTVPGVPAHRRPDAHRVAITLGRRQAGTLTPGPCDH